MATGFHAAPAAPMPDGSIADWLWLLLAVAVILAWVLAFTGFTITSLR